MKYIAKSPTLFTGETVANIEKPISKTTEDMIIEEEDTKKEQNEIYSNESV